MVEWVQPGVLELEAPPPSAPEEVELEVAVSDLIAPYGFELVERIPAPERAVQLRAEAARMPRIHVPERVLSDLYLLSVGALSPLEGFMDSGTYDLVLEHMRLPSGLPWTIPVVLPARDVETRRLAVGEPAALVTSDGEVAGVIDVLELFDRDLARESETVYGTTDASHPGVAAIGAMGDVYVAGPVRYLYDGPLAEGVRADEILTPAEARARIRDGGWKTVVAFQTRNPIHRAHEYLQKCALEVVDGLLVHPVVGEVKADDLSAEVRMECYRELLQRYFPSDRVMLAALPLAMRYAGPREAIFHAIIRRNFGCTHFIVGRDHAGVGNYYGTYDAQRIFDEIDGDLLGIQPLKFEHAFWCKKTGQMATAKTSPSGPEDRIFLSGTKVREMLARGEKPPVEFTRPEIAEILLRSARGD